MFLIIAASTSRSCSAGAPGLRRRLAASRLTDVTAGSPYPPPQAQKALVRGFGLLRRGGPKLSALWVNDPGGRAVELTNVGGDDAHGAAYALVDATGSVVTGPAGHLRPGESVSIPVHAQLRDGERLRCVWTCTDGRGRTHVWSNDGRHVRLRRREQPDAGAALARMYPDG
jgi:hypothetical protein